LLQHRLLVADTLDWVSGECPELNTPLKAKIRYRQAEQPCQIIEHANGQIVVEFDQPQTAVAPGQSVVFYNGDDCLGGGIIDQRLHILDERI